MAVSADTTIFAAAIAATVPLVVVIFTAMLGGLFWRTQLIGQRRFQVAEDSIVAFSLACDALRWARSPGGFSHEGRSRPGRESEDPQIAEQRDSYYRTLERLNDSSAAFAELRRVQLLAKHHLGPDAAAAFETLFEIRNRIQIGAAMLLNAAGTQTTSPHDVEFRLRTQSEIWANAFEDAIGDRLGLAERKMTAICNQQAQLSAAFWPFALGRRFRRAGEP